MKANRAEHTGAGPNGQPAVHARAAAQSLCGNCRRLLHTLPVETGGYPVKGPWCIAGSPPFIWCKVKPGLTPTLQFAANFSQALLTQDV